LGIEVAPHHATAARGGLELDTVEEPTSRPGVRSPDADLASPFGYARYALWLGGFSEAGSALAAGGADLVILLVGAVDAAGHAAAATARRTARPPRSPTTRSPACSPTSISRRPGWRGAS